MKLNAPKKITLLVAVILAVVGAVLALAINRSCMGNCCTSGCIHPSHPVCNT